MTAAQGGARRGASDKTECYERLRARLLEARRTPLAIASAAVLVRQGMSVWMQLDEDPHPGSRTADQSMEYSHALPAAEHSELLAVLTGLVFNLCRKESA